MNQEKNMEYLGDGVYVEYTGFSYILRANHHTSKECTDEIHLEPFVLQNLNLFLEKFGGKL